MKARSLAGPPFRKAARLTSWRYCATQDKPSVSLPTTQHT